MLVSTHEPYSARFTRNVAETLPSSGQMRSRLVRITAATLPFETVTRRSSPTMLAPPTLIRLQFGVGVTVGEAVAVGVAEGVKVGVGVRVLVGVKVGVAVPVGAKGLIGIPITRAVRNCSTIPVRCARRCRSGQNSVRNGVISGWLKSIDTMTVSPGSPAFSAGVQVEAEGVLVSPAV